MTKSAKYETFRIFLTRGKWWLVAQVVVVAAFYFGDFWYHNHPSKIAILFAVLGAMATGIAGIRNGRRFRILLGEARTVARLKKSGENGLSMDASWTTSEGLKVFVECKTTTSVATPRTFKLLLLLIPPRSREYVLGDLEEEYRTIYIPEYGVRIARWLYRWHVSMVVSGFMWDKLKRIAGWVVLLSKVK